MSVRTTTTAVALVAALLILPVAPCEARTARACSPVVEGDESGAPPDRAAPDAETAAALDRARAALRAGRADAAIEALAPHVDSDPTAVAPLLLDAFRTAHRFAAGRALIAGLEAAPDADPGLVIAVAQWEAEDGWVRRAEARLDAALAARPQDGDLLAARARLARSAGDPRAALDRAQAAIAAGVPADELDWLRAEALLELGRTEEAEHLLGEIIAARPGHLAARLALARRARARGDRTGALAGLRALLELDPDHAAALADAGSLLLRDPTTRSDGERALARFAEIRERRERIARLARERREGRDAPTLRIELAALLRSDRRPAEALAVAGASDARPAEESREGESAGGGDPDPTAGSEGVEPAASVAERAALLAEAARAFVDLGDPRAAIPRFARAIATDPLRSDLRLELAEALLSAGDPRGAAIALDRCRGAVDPRRFRLAEIECAARFDPSWDSLVPPLEELLAERPGDVEVARALSDAAVALGRPPALDALGTRLDALRAEHPALEGPLLARAWIALERPGADPGSAELAALAAEVRERARTAESRLWLAAFHAARGESAEAEAARREARWERALAGP